MALPNRNVSTNPEPGTGNPEPRSWVTEPSDAGERLDRAIAARFDDISRSYAVVLIESGAVSVSGNPVRKPAHKLKAGDRVAIEMPAPQPSALAAESIPLTIIYEDAHLLVIDKPAGMVVHPAPGHSGGTLVNAILAHVPELDLNMGDEARPGIVHRLDKDTSGLIVVAKRRKAHEALARQMSSRAMLKEYLALVVGKLKHPTGVIDAPIARDPRDRQRMAVVRGGREARTRYTVEREYGRYTLIRATLETGRTHQIRVHMSSIGHPLLGDPVYGKSTLKDAAALGLHRQFLHACRLGFILPSTHEWEEFSSPLPEELRLVLDRLSNESRTK